MTVAQKNAQREQQAQQELTFASQDLAVHYQFKKQGRWIVLGDNNQYWVTSWRYAQWLVNHGYELFN